MAFDINDIKKRMEGAFTAFQNELKGLRTGRASPNILDNVSVEAYGNAMPISQLGSVSVPEPRLITVQVWDATQVKAVEKAIRESGLGLNPQVDGSLLRIPTPELSEERRKELAFESLRMADLQRWKAGVHRMDVLPGYPANLPFPNDKAIAPIPLADITYTGIPQNSGY